MQFRLSFFEGPLDLLLHLIRGNELDLADIPIADITQQYLAFIEMPGILDLNDAAEYVVMAATLIEIKSRMLLPARPAAPGEEPEDPRAELVARLLEYERYQGTVETLKEWEELRRRLYFRGVAGNTDDYILPVGDAEAAPIQLYQALHRLLTEAGVEDRPVTAVTPRRRLSLKMKMIELMRVLSAAAPQVVPFEALFDMPCSRYDIILTFLALLELIRQGRAHVEQTEIWGPILISYTRETHD